MYTIIEMYFPIYCKQIYKEVYKYKAISFFTQKEVAESAMLGDRRLYKKSKGKR